jgi:hypothetical protein
MVQGRRIPDSPRAILAGLMLAVFLASVGIAWWLAARQGRPRENGAATIRLIRQRLSELWPVETETLWYLHRSQTGRPVGWSMVRRQRREGMFAGVKIVASRRTGQVYAERWEVGDGAAAGQYFASARGRSEVTRIALGAGKVAVERRAGFLRRQAEAPAPDNYIPEGLQPLALRLVATGQAEARFAFISNDESISEVGELLFSTLHVQPAGPRRLRLTYATHENRWSTLVDLDERGTVAGAHDLRSGVSYSRATLEELSTVFPEARRYADRDADPARNAPDSEDET